MLTVNIPDDKLSDVLRVLTGDYEVRHKGTIFPLPKEDVRGASVEEQRNPTFVAETAEEPPKPKRGRKPKVVEEVQEGAEDEAAPEPQVEEEDDAIIDVALASLNSSDDEAWATAAEEASEPAEIPARSWTDADLGALCSRVAGILGGPSQITELRDRYLPAGATVKHSRDIPQEDREEFASQLEELVRAKGGEYADFSY